LKKRSKTSDKKYSILQEIIQAAEVKTSSTMAGNGRDIVMIFKMKNPNGIRAILIPLGVYFKGY